mgnify:CR=1 FL=1
MYHVYVGEAVEATVAYASVNADTKLLDMPGGDAVADMKAGASVDILGSIDADGKTYSFVAVPGTEIKGYVGADMLDEMAEDAALAEARRALTEASIEGGFAVCGVSGGVDSMVAAMLAHQAFGERMTAIYVETGLMRAGDGAAVRAIYEQLGIPLRVIDRAEDVLASLRGRQTMGEKLAVVVSCLHEEMIRQTEAIPGAKTLVMGTNYSDFLGGTNNAAWKDCGMAVLEPLALLFRDEVNEIAGMLGLDDELLLRKPFPLMGLAARILGEVTPQRLSALRTADAIFSEEIREAGLHRKLYKYFPVLVDADELKGSCTIILRAVTVSGAMLVPARLPYDLVERTVERILETTPAVQRVFYDQTPTPVGKETFQ